MMNVWEIQDKSLTIDCDRISQTVHSSLMVPREPCAGDQSPLTCIAHSSKVRIAICCTICLHQYSASGLFRLQPVSQCSSASFGSGSVTSHKRPKQLTLSPSRFRVIKVVGYCCWHELELTSSSFMWDRYHKSLAVWAVQWVRAS